MVEKLDQKVIRESVRVTLGDDLYSKIEGMAFEKAEKIIEAMKIYDEYAELIKENQLARDMVRNSVIDSNFECAYELIDHCKKNNMYDFDIARLVTQIMPSQQEINELIKAQVQHAYFSART